ncbi:MAG: hypothetical protein MK132_14945 [Lentisphaerales bacterium]|nr:hypothetical protein [Lentisphaerales bacterium]
MPEVKDQIQTLFEKMLAKNMSAAERMSLNKIVQSSDEAQKYYLELCQMHAMLSDEHGAFAAGLGTVSQKSFTESKAKRKPPIFQFILSLAAILGITFLGLKMTLKEKSNDSAPFRGGVVATVSETVGAEFEYGNSLYRKIAKGDELFEGIYQLNKGLLEISYANGAQVLVEAPAKIELFSNNSMTLLSGKVSATVSKSASGYTVKGLGVSVVDIGTEFSVYVNPDKYLETHVFAGLVELEMHYETEDIKHRLKAGQAARVMMGTAGPVMAGIDLRKDFFIRHIHEGSSAYSQLIQSKKPAAYYPMNINTEDTILEDKSAYNNNGRAADVKEPSSFWVAGKIGSAIQLSGSNNKAYVYVDDYPKARQNKLTVVGWVYAESRPIWATIVKNWGQDVYGQFHFGLNPAGLLDIEVQSLDGERVHITENVTFPIRTWQHVAFVHDGNAVKLYRNGQVVARQKVNGIKYPTKLKKLSIGTKLEDDKLTPANTPGHWDGRLDEVAIFNHALSDEEVSELYNAAN